MSNRASLYPPRGKLAPSEVPCAQGRHPLKMPQDASEGPCQPSFQQSHPARAVALASAPRYTRVGMPNVRPQSSGGTRDTPTTSRAPALRQCLGQGVASHALHGGTNRLRCVPLQSNQGRCERRPRTIRGAVQGQAPTKSPTATASTRAGPGPTSWGGPYVWEPVGSVLVAACLG